MPQHRGNLYLGLKPDLDIGIATYGMDVPTALLKTIPKSDDEVLVTENERHSGLSPCKVFSHNVKPSVGFTHGFGCKNSAFPCLLPKILWGLVEGAVLAGLGEFFCGDVFVSIEIGAGPCHSEDSVVGACGEVFCFQGDLHEVFPVVIEGAELIESHSLDAGVIGDSGVLVSEELSVTCLQDLFAEGL